MLKTEPGRPLTSVEAVLLSGAVAVKGEGVAKEGVGVCDNSEVAPPITDPDDDPSAMEKTPDPVVVELLLLCRLPFLRSDGDFWIPPLTPMTPNPLSPPAPPPTVTNPLLETKLGRPESVEDEEEEGEAMGAEEEVVLAEEEVGSVREGAGSEGFTSVVKQGPNLFRQLPFFFFFTPSSPPAVAAAPIPRPELGGGGRL